MKLYTEEQAKYFFDCGRNFQMNGEITFSIAQQELPIELPSDEDIEEGSRNYIKGTDLDTFVERTFFKSGAKWIKEQILNQNK